MLLNEDLTIFFSDFAEPVKIDNVGVLGIFDESFSPVFPGEVSEGKSMTLLVRSDVVKDVEHGAEVELRDRFFEVVEVQPTDDGKLTSLVLKELE